MKGQILEYKTDAIILSERDILKGNRTVSILTREYGVIDAFANGSKSTKSKILGITQPLSYSSMTINKKKQYYSVKDGRMKNMFYSIKEDMDALFLAFYLAEITRDIAPKAENAQEHLELFLSTLHQLEKKALSYKQIKAVYELRLLSISGYLPNLAYCSECGVFEGKEMCFFLEDAELICGDCIDRNIKSQTKYKLSTAALLALRHILYSEDEKLFSFVLKGKSLELVSAICERYLLEQMGRTYNTLKFYTEINQ